MNCKNDPVVPKKLIIPFILVTLLFAMWGFANSVTDPMVQAFKKVLELSNTQASWIQMAFYGGYFQWHYQQQFLLENIHINLEF